jgi:hypothetical protein
MSPSAKISVPTVQMSVGSGPSKPGIDWQSLTIMFGHALMPDFTHGGLYPPSEETDGLWQVVCAKCT